MRAKANWNLFVRLCGAIRIINPANINQVSNIRSETLVCFFVILANRILPEQRHDSVYLSIEYAFYSHPYSLLSIVSFHNSRFSM
jgi:hypothetical protein